MAGRLIEGQPDIGLLLDQQEFAVTLDDSSNRNVGFPDHEKALSAKALF
jgi:hypothetical protein